MYTLEMDLTFGVPSTPREYWRVNHDSPLWRFNLPEVDRIQPDNPKVPLGREMQYLWRNMNPQLSDDQYRALYDNTLAFTNGTGFPGHHDYINDLDADKEDPSFDAPRLCGGAIVSGIVFGENLYIASIDVRQPLPSAEMVMAHPHLYFEAVNIAEQADGTPVVRRFKGGWDLPVYVPIATVVDGPYLPLSMLTKIPTGSPLPSPFQYYYNP